MSPKYIMKLSSMCTLCIQVLKSLFTYAIQTVHISHRVPLLMNITSLENNRIILVERTIPERYLVDIQIQGCNMQANAELAILIMNIKLVYCIVKITYHRKMTPIRLSLIVPQVATGDGSTRPLCEQCSTLAGWLYIN